MTITHLPESAAITDGSKPAYPGIYKRRVFLSSQVTYNKWNGRRWLAGAGVDGDGDWGHQRAFDIAMRAVNISDFQTPAYWWGLAEEPKA